MPYKAYSKKNALAKARKMRSMGYKSQVYKLDKKGYGITAKKK